MTVCAADGREAVAVVCAHVTNATAPVTLDTSRTPARQVCDADGCPVVAVCSDCWHDLAQHEPKGRMDEAIAAAREEGRQYGRELVRMHELIAAAAESGWVIAERTFTAAIRDGGDGAAANRLWDVMREAGAAYMARHPDLYAEVGE